MLAACLLALFGAFASVVLYKLLTGQIRCAGMFSNEPGDPPLPERVQALFVAMVAIGGYALTTFQSAAHGNLSALPDVPNYLIELLGGSQLLYVVGKYLRNR